MTFRQALTFGNHCAHVTKFYETKIEETEDNGEEIIGELLGKILIYMVAEH